MVSRRHKTERESRRGRITIGRRVGKIGFMGKGVGVSSREKSDVAHGLALRIDEDLIEEGHRERDRVRDDAAPKPDILRKVFSHLPDVVVFPDSGQCVADIIDVCIEERTPAVPRGLGSAGLGGAVPVRGGVVVDLSKMTEVVSLDAKRLMVTVQAGCTWDGLRDVIGREGLALCSYPSKRGGSTVGGWLSTGGYGTGTRANGRFHASVESAEVAVPSGILVNAGHGEGRYSIESFSGTEGQLGIVTGVRFRVKTRPEVRVYYAMEVRRIEDGVGVLRRLASVDPPLFGIRLISRNLRGGVGGMDRERTSKEPVVAALLEGTEHEARVFDVEFKNTASKLGLDILASEEAGAVFETQVDDAAAKDKTLVRSGEVLVELDHLPEFLNAVPSVSGEEAILDVHLVDRALALVMVFALRAGPDLPPVIRDVPMTFRVSRMAMKCGGRPYGIGLWNTPFAGHAMADRYRTWEVIKKETDRVKILNPGKFFTLATSGGLPVWGWTYKVGLTLIGRSR